MPAKTTTKKASQKTEEKQDGRGSHRAATRPNENGFACPECWAVPDAIRNDDISTARHMPATPKARTYRDTHYCNGQGRQGRYVIDKQWKPGTQPKEAITANEFVTHGTTRYEERQKRAQEKAERSQKAAKNAKAPGNAKGKGKGGRKGAKKAAA